MSDQIQHSARASVAELSFFFDPLSPYAYLAFERMPVALEGLSLVVHYRPILFAGLLKALGNKGPAEVPGKREWTYRQVLWLADHLGIPLELPPCHPFNPLPLLRLGLSVEDSLPGTVNRLVAERLFRHVWRGGLDPLDPARLDNLQQELQMHAHARGKAWLSPEADAVKQRLRANTEEALAMGVFGVPTFALGQKLFWGLDALPMLRACIESDPWFASGRWASVEGWPAMKRE